MDEGTHANPEVTNVKKIKEIRADCQGSILNILSSLKVVARGLPS